MWETWVRILGWKNPLEEAMATHSSVVAWRIPWTEEHDGLQSMGSQRVRHDWETKHSTPLWVYSLSIFFLHSLSPLLSASRLNTLNFSMTISTRLNCFILCLVLLHIRHWPHIAISITTYGAYDLLSSESVNSLECLMGKPCCQHA